MLVVHQKNRINNKTRHEAQSAAGLETLLSAFSSEVGKEEGQLPAIPFQLGWDQGGCKQPLPCRHPRSARSGWPGARHASPLQGAPKMVSASKGTPKQTDEGCWCDQIPCASSDVFPQLGYAGAKSSLFPSLALKGGCDEQKVARRSGHGTKELALFEGDVASG